MYLIGWGDTANSVWGEKAQGWLGVWVWLTGQTSSQGQHLQVIQGRGMRTICLQKKNWEESSGRRESVTQNKPSEATE